MGGISACARCATCSLTGTDAASSAARTTFPSTFATNCAGFKTAVSCLDADNGLSIFRNGPGPKLNWSLLCPGRNRTCWALCAAHGGYLPFCEVEWGGITGWASSCRISDMEQFPSPQLLQPQAPQPANALTCSATNISIQPESTMEWSDRASGQSPCRMELACHHKVNGQLFDRTEQYRISAFIRIKATPELLLGGRAGKDPERADTGHLWDNAGVWMYEEHMAFRDGQPGKLGTPPATCQPVGQQ